MNDSEARLHGLARRALERYRMRPTGMVAMGDPGLFRVEAPRGPFRLRVGPRRSESPLHVRTEVDWLERLASVPEVSAPVPVGNRDGLLVTTVGLADAPGRHDCVLFEWIPGRVLGTEATRFDWGLLGETAGHLHADAARWHRRSGLRPLVWDRVCWRPGEPPVLFDDDHRALMTKRRRRVVDAVNRRVGSELRRLHRRPTQLLHGDLHPGNAHLHRSALHVGGFERVMLGAPVQDIAISLHRARRRRDYRSVLESFVDGYRSIREWPVEFAGQVNLLMAGLDLLDLNRSLLDGTATDRSVGRLVDRIGGAVNQ